MALFIDARIPVWCDPPAAGVAAWLVQGDAPAPHAGASEYFRLATVHVPGCACCLPRGEIAAALNRLFLRRAKGEVPFFDHVNVQADATGRAAVAAALADDGFVSARYRAA